MRVEMGHIALPTSFDGVIVRDEVVYHADVAGALVFHVENHERVRRGRVVASLQDAAAVQTYRRSLAVVDQQALDAQRQRGGVNEEEIAARNRNLAAHASNAAFGLSAGGVGGVFALSSRVTQGMESRNELYFDAMMVDLQTARSQALSGLSASAREVASGVSGLISTSLDGLEDVVTLANMSNIPREIFRPSGLTAEFAGPDVAAGDAIFRVIRSNDWRIVAYLPQDYAQSLNLWAGMATTLFVETDGTPLPLVAEIEALQSAGADVRVIFVTNRDIMRFIDVRRVGFRLEAEPQEGLKIPWSAIVERGIFEVPSEFVFRQEGTLGGVDAVNMRFGDTVQAQPVMGTRSRTEIGETFSIIAEAGGLRFGDVLVNGDETFQLEHITTVFGVYVTNAGATQFRRVEIEGAFAQNADYVILDPARNPNLRPFDRIVPDARAIGDRLLLY